MTHLDLLHRLRPLPGTSKPEGQTAELFLALQRSVAGFEKLIVVKRVLPNLVKDESFIEMLLAEAADRGDPEPRRTHQPADEPGVDIR